MSTTTIKPRDKSAYEAWDGGRYVAKRHAPLACPCCGKPVYYWRCRERSLAGSRLWRIGCGSCDGAIISQNLHDLYDEDFAAMGYQENPIFSFLSKDREQFDGGNYMLPIPLTR